MKKSLLGAHDLKRLCMMVVSCLLLSGCAAALPDVNLSQPISDLMGTPPYSPHSMVDTARQIVSRSMTTHTAVEVGSLQATYLCARSSCELQHLLVEIGVQRPRSLFAALDDVHDNASIAFVFDLSVGSVRADTQLLSDLRLPNPAWSTIPVPLEHAQVIALDAVDWDEGPIPFRMTIYRQPEAWEVTFNRDLTGQTMSEIRLNIDYMSGEVIETQP